MKSVSVTWRRNHARDSAETEFAAVRLTETETTPKVNYRQFRCRNRNRNSVDFQLHSCSKVYLYRMRLIVACAVLCSVVYRRLRDVIDDVTARQFIVDSDTVDGRSRSSGSVPRHRHIQIGPETLQLSLVAGSAVRPLDRRRVEDLTRRMDGDRLRPERSVQ